MGSNLQETEPKCDIHGNLLLCGQWKAVDKFDRKTISDQVSCDVESSIGQVEVIDVDTLLLCHAQVPGCFDGTALEGARKNVAQTLATDNSNHDQRSSSESWISETAVHNKNREFDQAKASIVEDRGQPDDLLRLSNF